MRIVVTINPTALRDIDAVAGRLTAAGMTVDQILSTTGIITGTADAGAVAALRRLAGVAAVGSDADFPAPPDSAH